MSENLDKNNESAYRRRSVGEHLYFAEWDGPFEPGITDAATAAARWVGAAGTAQQRFTEGVQSTTKDPTALAVNAQAKMRQNVVAAIDSGRWARGLQKAGKAGIALCVEKADGILTLERDIRRLAGEAS